MYWKPLEVLSIIQAQSVTRRTSGVANDKATSPSDTYRAGCGAHSTTYHSVRHRFQRKPKQRSLSPISYRLIGIVWNVKTNVRPRLTSAFPLKSNEEPRLLLAYSHRVAWHNVLRQHTSCMLRTQTEILWSVSTYDARRETKIQRLTSRRPTLPTEIITSDVTNRETHSTSRHNYHHKLSRDKARLHVVTNRHTSKIQRIGAPTDSLDVPSSVTSIQPDAKHQIKQYAIRKRDSKENPRCRELLTNLNVLLLYNIFYHIYHPDWQSSMMALTVA